MRQLGRWRSAARRQNGDLAPSVAKGSGFPCPLSCAGGSVVGSGRSVSVVRSGARGPLRRADGPAARDGRASLRRLAHTVESAVHSTSLAAAGTTVTSAAVRGAVSATLAASAAAAVTAILLRRDGIAIARLGVHRLLRRGVECGEEVGIDEVDLHRTDASAVVAEETAAAAEAGELAAQALVVGV